MLEQIRRLKKVYVGAAFWQSVFILLLFLSFGLDSFANTPVKYKTAMVFPAGSFHIPMFLGMLEVAEERGLKPDVIVGACGGSVAAAIANAFPTSSARKEFVESEIFYELFRDMTFNKNGVFQLLKQFKRIADLKKQKPSGQKIPDIFNNFTLQLPFTSKNLGDLSFPFHEDGIPIVIVAGEVNFSPDDVRQKRNGRKLFTETYFTDKQTAQLLENFPSPVYSEENAVALQTKVITDATLADAARGSIADPFGIQPHKIGDTYYVTGGVDLYPLEVALQVAEKISFMPRSLKFDKLVFERAFQGLFRYSNNERLANVDASTIPEHRADFTDYVTATAKFGPGIEIPKGKFVNRTPATREEFVKIMRKIWNYGRTRTLSALDQPLGN